MDKRTRTWAALVLVGLVVAALVVGCDRPATVRPGDQPTAPLLAFARTGGIAGFQDRLVIGYGNEYHLLQSNLERIGTLSPARRVQMDTWRDGFAPFTLTLEDNPGGPDNMVRQLVWAGLGRTNASQGQQQEILDWANGLFVELSAPGR